MYSYVKTTIDVPDELLHRAKVVAAQRRTTLRELVVRGLDRAIQEVMNGVKAQKPLPSPPAAEKRN